ncbi:hypothetical protein I533_13705 [Alteromonas mediterranea MED64]|nr:hypothetical protein I533_13705 [Alteromonas mediterranea MED64]
MTIRRIPHSEKSGLFVINRLGGFKRGLYLANFYDFTKLMAGIVRGAARGKGQGARGKGQGASVSPFNNLTYVKTVFVGYSKS